MRKASSSTASRRSWTAPIVSCGRSSHDRSRRLAIDVTVRSSSSSSEPWRPPSDPSRISRCSERRRIDEQGICPLPIRDRANVGEISFLRAAEVVNQRSCGAHGPGVSIEAESLQAAGMQLFEQGPARGFAVECPRIDRRERQVGCRERRPSRGQFTCRRGRVERSRIARHNDLARFQHGDFVGQRLQAFRAGVLSGCKFTGGHVEQRDAVRRLVARIAGRNGHQKCRLLRLEVVRVGEGSRRDDANDFTLDDALGFARILDLIADGDAKAFLHEARDVRIDCMKRDAAHRNPAAVCVFGTRGQGQLERPRGQQGVFVKHLVEVAHAEEEDRVAMLLLGVQILPHRRRGRR